MNQAYVIATSTKVSLTGVNAAAIDDAFFARNLKAEAAAAATGAAKGPSDARKAAQTQIDAALTANIKKVAQLDSYLKAKFSLRNGDLPHTLKF